MEVNRDGALSSWNNISTFCEKIREDTIDCAGLPVERGWTVVRPSQLKSLGQEECARLASLQEMKQLPHLSAWLVGGASDMCWLERIQKAPSQSELDEQEFVSRQFRSVCANLVDSSSGSRSWQPDISQSLHFDEQLSPSARSDVGSRQPPSPIPILETGRPDEPLPTSHWGSTSFGTRSRRSPSPIMIPESRTSQQNVSRTESLSISKPIQQPEPISSPQLPSSVSTLAGIARMGEASAPVTHILPIAERGQDSAFADLSVRLQITDEVSVAADGDLSTHIQRKQKRQDKKAERFIRRTVTLRRKLEESLRRFLQPTKAEIRHRQLFVYLSEREICLIVSNIMTHANHAGMTELVAKCRVATSMPFELAETGHDPNLGTNESTSRATTQEEAKAEIEQLPIAIFEVLCSRVMVLASFNGVALPPGTGRNRVSSRSCHRPEQEKQEIFVE